MSDDKLTPDMELSLRMRAPMRPTRSEWIKKRRAMIDLANRRYMAEEAGHGIGVVLHILLVWPLKVVVSIITYFVILIWLIAGNMHAIMALIIYGILIGTLLLVTYLVVGAYMAGMI